jgi:methylenetetrahydrofolate dehydrogenase (NADP+)/methenyltetrahydrofolate cyclohydrolase
LDTKILFGKAVSIHIKEELSKDIACLKEKNIIPGLAAIIIGDDPASKVYVRNKSKTFKSNGCYSETFSLPTNTSEKDLLDLIDKLNNDKKFHGILVQLPLPDHINSKNILNHVNPDKDVDGFHPLNLGHLLEGEPSFIPCTPNGIIKMLEYYNIETAGKHTVIIGRSNIVGKPMFALLSQKFKVGNSTVTMCHTGTDDISYYTKQADIVIAAVGVPEMLKGDMIKEGVCLIDVGINRVEDLDSEKGYKLVGDIDAKSVMNKASSLSPVPGGVGPMTITMLLYNTVNSALKSS